MALAADRGGSEQAAIAPVQLHRILGRPNQPKRRLRSDPAVVPNSKDPTIDPRREQFCIAAPPKNAEIANTVRLGAGRMRMAAVGPSWRCGDDKRRNGDIVVKKY